jgi:glyoxylase-like metal-dependent hydrolase (beta-lactamase superfamily II)
MDGDFGPLRFPVVSPPPVAGTWPVAPGVWWVRMPLPFALDHINLWLLEDADAWTIVDAGYALAETRAAWERIFADRFAGRPVKRIIVTHYHPDHIGLAGWLAERWRVLLWITEKFPAQLCEILAALAHHPGVQPLFRPPRRP